MTDASYILFINCITNTYNLYNEARLSLKEPLIIPEFETYTETEFLKARVKELRSKLDKKYRHVKQLELRIAQLEGRYISQSSPTGVSEMQLDSANTQTITAFADQDAGWATELEGTYEPTMDLGNNEQADLATFLSRPIRQSAQTWAVNQSLFYKFNPWAAFCENAIVRDKIKNYELLRMKLHCKMVISGTQFHYGRALVSYNPYTYNDQITVERDFFNTDLVAASQKPHFFLDPAKNTGGELCMPFMWHNNFLEIPKSDWDDMGEIVIKSFSNLQHANLGNDPVTVTTYIWATDVVLTMPTSSDPPVALTSQSSKPRALGAKNQSNKMSADEYGTGIISKPAAAVSEAAGALEKVPVIGPYMTATKIATGAVADIARSFGLSRPSVITDVVQQKPLPAGNLCNTDAADAVQKLTLDSKAEVTIDSRTAGLNGEDEMGIVDYAMRESYLTTFTWTPTQTPDTLLWNARVTPMLYGSLDAEFHMTPMAHIATAFEQWQGSIKYRFQIVKSNFHKGRLLVRWDPNNFTSAVNYNTNYSRVVDIAEEEDFEIVVGWGRAKPWLQCSHPYEATGNFDSSSRLTENPNDANGVLELAVLNDLVSPSTDSSITVNVYVSACEDFKLAAPTNDKLKDYHLFPQPLASQSSEPTMEMGAGESDKPTGATEIQSIVGESKPSDETYLVYYGDPPTSIRELCKRYTFTRGWMMPAANADTMRINGLRNKNAPYNTGYDIEGIDLAANGTSKVTVGSTAFSSWFTPCYAGVRGAYRKKYMLENADDAAPCVIRQPYKNADNGTVFSSELAFSTTTAVQTKYLSSRYNIAGGAGTAATNCGVNNTIEVELPYYMPKRFSAARQVSAQSLDCNSHQIRSRAVHGGSGTAAPKITTPVIYQYDAVGEDFSLFCFAGVPIYYRYTLNETT